MSSVEEGEEDKEPEYSRATLKQNMCSLLSRIWKYKMVCRKRTNWLQFLLKRKLPKKFGVLTWNCLPKAAMVKQNLFEMIISVICPRSPEVVLHVTDSCVKLQSCFTKLNEIFYETVTYSFLPLHNLMPLGIEGVLECIITSNFPMVRLWNCATLLLL